MTTRTDAEALDSIARLLRNPEWDDPKWMLEVVAEYVRDVRDTDPRLCIVVDCDREVSEFNGGEGLAEGDTMPVCWEHAED